MKKSRNYEALSWRSTCIDEYQWESGDDKLQFEIAYHLGFAPKSLFTDRELNAALVEWSKGGPGQFYVNNQRQER